MAEACSMQRALTSNVARNARGEAACCCILAEPRAAACSCAVRTALRVLALGSGLFPMLGESRATCQWQGCCDEILSASRGSPRLAVPEDAGRGESRHAAPFKGFAHAPFNSVAAFACGPYAVRVQIVPGASNGALRWFYSWATSSGRR